MKKIICTILILTTFQANAQINSELKAHYEAYYKQMKMQGDVRGAIDALTHLNIIAPLQTQKDTLGYLYANSGQYMQAINVLGSEKNTNDSDLALRIKAISLKSLGQPQLAVEHYKVLFDRNPNAHIAYELTDLNLQVGKSSEAKTYLDYGFANLKDEDMQSFYESNPPYQVPLKAAFLYLKGLYYYNLNKEDIDTAVKTIDEAVNMAPNFTLAKQIREALLRQKGQ